MLSSTEGSGNVASYIAWTGTAIITGCSLYMAVKCSLLGDQDRQEPKRRESNDWYQKIDAMLETYGSKKSDHVGHHDSGVESASEIATQGISREEMVVIKRLLAGARARDDPQLSYRAKISSLNDQARALSRSIEKKEERLEREGLKCSKIQTMLAPDKTRLVILEKEKFVVEVALASKLAPPLAKLLDGSGGNGANLQGYWWDDMLAHVTESWTLVQNFGEEAAGVELFKNIFSIAPQALKLFSFSEEEDLYESPALKLHGATVVKTVGVAVTGLKSLNDLVPTLQSLGRRHQKYGVIPEHYEVVGQALIATLRAALGEKFTPDVESAWTTVYHIVSSTMISATATNIENSDSTNPSTYAMSSSDDEGEAALDQPTSESSIELDPTRVCPHLRRKIRWKKF